MKSTLDYLDEAMMKLGLDHDDDMAEVLGKSIPYVADVRFQRNIMDGVVVRKLAEILEIETHEIQQAAQDEIDALHEEDINWTVTMKGFIGFG